MCAWMGNIQEGLPKVSRVVRKAPEELTQSMQGRKWGGTASKLLKIDKNGVVSPTPANLSSDYPEMKV